MPEKLSEARMPVTRLIITDHALIRYMERVKGMYLEPIRDEIRQLLDEHRENSIPDHGYADGYLFVLDCGALTTVLPPSPDGGRSKQKIGKHWLTRTLVHVPTADRKTSKSTPHA